MKKSELIQQLIEFEEKSETDSTITMKYIHYLKKLKRILEVGDVEI